MEIIAIQKRKQNTPKKYPNKGTGQGKNPRSVCPECEKTGVKVYMKKTQCRYIKDGKVVTVMPLSFCKNCKHIEWNDDELRKIPD